MRVDLGRQGSFTASASIPDQIPAGQSGEQVVSATNWLATSVNCQVFSRVDPGPLQYSGGATNWTAHLHVRPQRRSISGDDTQRGLLSHDPNACAVQSPHRVFVDGGYSTGLGPVTALNADVLSTGC